MVQKGNGFSKRLGVHGDNSDVSIIITKRKIRDSACMVITQMCQS